VTFRAEPPSTLHVLLAVWEGTGVQHASTAPPQRRACRWQLMFFHTVSAGVRLHDRHRCHAVLDWTVPCWAGLG
jgi:hypothetical protein